MYKVQGTSNEADIYFLQRENENLKQQISSFKNHLFGYNSIKSDEKNI